MSFRSTFDGKIDLSMIFQIFYSIPKRNRSSWRLCCVGAFAWTRLQCSGWLVDILGSDHSCPPSSLVSPKRMVCCSGGSRYVEGCWRFPFLEIKKFISFKVPKLKRFKVSKYQSFRVSKVYFSNFQKFEFQIFKMCGTHISNMSNTRKLTFPKHIFSK